MRAVETSPSLIDRLRIVKVIFDALTNDDPDKVSVSRMALFRLGLKESFAAAAQYPIDMAKARFLYYGDTNHLDGRLHTFFYSEQNMDRMADAGVKHIFPRNRTAVPGKGRSASGRKSRCW
jgi:hypothetical protein